MAALNQARFTINGTPSSDPSTGDRIFIATNGQTLSITLEQDPGDVLSVRYQVFDPDDASSPLASHNAPLVEWNENSEPAILFGPTPYGINDVATLTLPADGFHSYVLRATASTAGDGSSGSQQQVFERLVVILSLRGSPAFRKSIPYESTQGNARGTSDTLNDMMDAIVAFISGGGGVVTAGFSATFADAALDPTTKRITFTHGMDTNYVACTVRDNTGLERAHNEYDNKVLDSGHVMVDLSVLAAAFGGSIPDNWTVTLTGYIG